MRLHNADEDDVTSCRSSIGDGWAYSRSVRLYPEVTSNVNNPLPLPPRSMTFKGLIEFKIYLSNLINMQERVINMQIRFDWPN